MDTIIHTEDLVWHIDNYTSKNGKLPRQLYRDLTKTISNPHIKYFQMNPGAIVAIPYRKVTGIRTLFDLMSDETRGFYDYLVEQTGYPLKMERKDMAAFLDNACATISNACTQASSSIASLGSIASSSSIVGTTDTISIDKNAIVDYSYNVNSIPSWTTICNDEIYSKNSNSTNCKCCCDGEKVKEEKKSMFNFDFGKITGDTVRISAYGIAVKSVDGRYVSYDPKTHSVMDVEIMNMPCGDLMYKMPVAIKDIKSGDVVIHNRVPMFVVEVHASTIKVIDIREGSEKEIYLTKSPFGFNFATKVVSLFDFAGNKTATETNPFGNILPFLMMKDSKDFDPMMFMLMSGGKMDMSNPMMMYFLMKDGKMNDALPFLMMMNNQPIEK